MKYRFIIEHSRDYPVTSMCQALEVSASGYYAWKQRPPSAHQRADDGLKSHIGSIHVGTHHIYGADESRGTGGARNLVWMQAGGAFDAPTGAERTLATASNSHHG
jgi:hypothetical protein